MLSNFEWNIPTIAIMGAFLVPIVAIVAAAYVKVVRTRALSELKARLIEKGMSADEIQRVVEAGEGPDK